MRVTVSLYFTIKCGVILRGTLLMFQSSGGLWYGTTGRLAFWLPKRNGSEFTVDSSTNVKQKNIPNENALLIFIFIDESIPERWNRRSSARAPATQNGIEKKKRNGSVKIRYLVFLCATFATCCPKSRWDRGQTHYGIALFLWYFKFINIRNLHRAYLCIVSISSDERNFLVHRKKNDWPSVSFFYVSIWLIRWNNENESWRISFR